MTKQTLIAKLDSAKLKKVRSKMIREALEHGASEKGNHRVELIGITEDATFAVYYRGTIIAEVIVGSEHIAYMPIGAGEFENTPATMRQRKEIKEALDELYKAVS